MAKQTRLKKAAVKIGIVAARADRAAHKVAKAAQVAKKELPAVSSQLGALKRQLVKSNKRVMHALD